MTTIVIEQDLPLKTTTFKNPEELMQALQKISPVKLVQTDIEELPTATQTKLKASQANTNKKLVDFQG